MIRTAIVTAALLSASAAQASSSNVIETEGAQIRLVSSGVPGAGGAIDAVLEIALAPGWKTYWIDPGEAGVPPSLTLAVSSDPLPLRLPAPGFIEEGGATLAGYDRSVRFLASIPAGDGPVEADLFVGICEKICVPVSGRLVLDPSSDPNNARDAAIVEEAEAALPRAPDATFQATATRLENGTLAVEAVVPPEASEATLFVASQGEWLFSQAGTTEVAGQRATFSIPATVPDSGAWPGDGFLYVLVADGRAVEGRLTKP